MQQRTVKIKDEATGEVQEFITPFAIKESYDFVTAFLDTHFETVSTFGEVCRLFNYNKLNVSFFSGIKEIPLSEFYETKNIALGFDTTPKESESVPAQETATKPAVEKKVTLYFSGRQSQELTTPCAFYYDSERSGRIYYKCLNTHFEDIHDNELEINDYIGRGFLASGIITVEEFELLKNNIVDKPEPSVPAQEVETNQTELIKYILREHNKLHDALKDSASYKAGVLMSNLKVLIDKLK